MTAAGSSLAVAQPHCNSNLSRSHVVVTVKFFDGWGRSVIGALDGRGTLKIVGAYSDTTSIMASMEPDSAVAMVDKLLALDFYGQPEMFDTGRFHLRACSLDSVMVTEEETFDGGSATIELFLGPRHHRVVLGYPAYGAPKALKDWLSEFRGLVKKHADWALQ
jgi:hypothetical protein